MFFHICSVLTLPSALRILGSFIKGMTAVCAIYDNQELGGLCAVKCDNPAVNDVRSGSKCRVGFSSSYRRFVFYKILELFQNVHTYGDQVGLTQNMG